MHWESFSSSNIWTTRPHNTTNALLQTKVWVFGGYDPISEFAYAGFSCLRLVAEGPLRPFTADREGMRVGEGYGVFVLERSSEARARGADPKDCEPPC